jgi:hypothetical protein
LGILLRDAYECAVDFQLAMAEQARQQPKGEAGECLIDKRLLPFKSIHRAAAWGILFTTPAICDFRK